jgi:hypothetical protein
MNDVAIIEAHVQAAQRALNTAANSTHVGIFS